MAMLIDTQEWLNLVHMALTFVSGNLVTSAQLRKIDSIEGRVSDHVTTTNNKKTHFWSDHLWQTLGLSSVTAFLTLCILYMEWLTWSVSISYLGPALLLLPTWGQSPLCEQPRGEIPHQAAPVPATSSWQWGEFTETKEIGPASAAMKAPIVSPASLQSKMPTHHISKPLQIAF